MRTQAVRIQPRKLLMSWMPTRFYTREGSIEIDEISESMNEPPGSLANDMCSQRIARNLGGSFILEKKKHFFSVRGNEGNQSDSDDGRESEESIVPIKLGHCI